MIKKIPFTIHIISSFVTLVYFLTILFIPLSTFLDNDIFWSSMTFGSVYISFYYFVNIPLLLISLISLLLSLKLNDKNFVLKNQIPILISQISLVLILYLVKIFLD